MLAIAVASPGAQNGPAAEPLLGGTGVPVRVGFCVERPAVPLRWFFRAGLGLLLFVWLWWVLVC